MKRLSNKIIAMILVLTIIVSGIGAYFTGTDRADDSYTIGKIEIALNGSDDLNKVEDLVPWDEYSFVRNVENTGINDAFVFMSVTIPYDTTNLHDADGNTIYENEDIQLFRYGTDGNAGVASQWKLVDAGKFADLDIQDMSATGIIEVSDTHGAVDTDDMSVTYVYGYVGDNADGSLKALAAGEITEDICDTMKFANVTDWNMEEKEGIILTRAYGIQTLNVLETNPLTGDNADGSVDVNAVWSVINNSRVGDGSVTKNETFIPVTAVDQNGTDLDATSTLITGSERDELLDALDNQGLANSDEVDYLIDIKSDDFEDLADTTFDMSGIASEGDKVIILHYDETKGEWEYITEDTVDGNLTVGGDFSSFSPVAIIIVPKEDTEYEMVEKTIRVLAPNGDRLNKNSYEMYTSDNTWEAFGTTDENGEAVIEFPLNTEFSYFVYGSANFDKTPQGTMTVTEETPEVIEFKYTDLDEYCIKIVDTNGVVFGENISITAGTSAGDIDLNYRNNEYYRFEYDDLSVGDTITITSLSNFTLTEDVVIEADKPYYTAVVEPWEMSTVTFKFVDEATGEDMDWFCLEIDGKEVELESGDSLSFMKGSTHEIYACEDCFEGYTLDAEEFTADGDMELTITVSGETVSNAETYTINLYTQNGDGTPFNDPVAINGPDGWSFEGDGATDDDGYQYIFGEGPDGLGVTKVDAGFVVPAGDYTVIDPSTGKQATFTVDHDGDYVAVLRAVSAELVEHKLIIKDQDGDRISKAYYELGYDGGDAMGITDENGEAVVELPNDKTLSITIYTSDAYGDPDEYIFYGSIEKLTEETPYEISLPNDMDSVDWF